MHSGFQNAINHIDKTFGYLIFLLTRFCLCFYLIITFFVDFIHIFIYKGNDRYRWNHEIQKNVSLSSVIIQNINLLKETLLNTV